MLKILLKPWREGKKSYVNYKIGNFLWQLSEDRTLGTEKSTEQQKWQNWRDNKDNRINRADAPTFQWYGEIQVIDRKEVMKMAFVYAHKLVAFVLHPLKI